MGTCLADDKTVALYIEKMTGMGCTIEGKIEEGRVRIKSKKHDIRMIQSLGGKWIILYRD